MQKTFKTDILSGKTSRNTGQLPMYFIRNSLGLCVVETCERKLLVFRGFADVDSSKYLHLKCF